MRQYIILGNPRSGSNLVCRTLATTKVLGYPREFFNPVHVEERFVEIHATDTMDYARQLVEHYQRGDAFGLKIHYHQLRKHFLDHDLTLREAFPDAKYVFLRRMKKLRQAISFEKACQTQSWTSTMPARCEPEYKFQETLRHFVDSIVQEHGWLDYFKDTQTEFLETTYELLSEDRAAFFDQLMNYLEVPELLDGLEQFDGMKKQANMDTEKWVDRFVVEMQSLPRADLDALIARRFDILQVPPREIVEEIEQETKV